MTLDQMVGAIQNNIGAGLKETYNFPYSREQIWDQISNLRSDIIYKLSKTGKLNPTNFAQTPSTFNIELIPGPYPHTSYDEAGNEVPGVVIPKLAQTFDNKALVYFGPSDMSLNMTMYYTMDAADMHKYNRVIGNRPYAVIGNAQTAEGDLPVYLFNLGPTPFKYITVRAIFDDPVRVIEEFDELYAGEVEFPAPLGIQEMIIDMLADKYITYYRKLAHPNESNDQTDKH